MTVVSDELRARLRGELRGEVRADLPLAPLTTYRIGGPADLAVFPANAEDLARAVRLLAAAGVPWEVLGGGSNVLISDRGVRGVVVVTTSLDALTVEGTTLRAEAGAASHAVARAALAAGLAGAEFLTWLPGSIGGACLMNARAHGGEVSQVLREARCLRRGDGRAETLALAPDQFAYKRSPFARRGLILVEATLALAPGEPAAIGARMDAIEAARRANHELDHPSCGCVFKNDHRIGRSSGRLIDECGLKGYRVGDAQVSPHHANFVLNLGSATAADVRAVMEHVHATVRRTTGHDLEREVRLLGEWDAG